MQDIKEIWLAFKGWLLHLLDPHCDGCEHDKQCKNCEYLRLLIEQERAEKGRILAMMFEEKEVTETVNTADWKPVSRFTPWHVTRQRLERDSRIKAEKLKAQKEENNGSIDIDQESATS